MLNEQIGQYRITGRLGQGGMGEIFSARDEKLNRTVAVKFIANAHMDSDSSRRLFLREARAAAALDHPFICTIHDVLEHEGQPVIVMEYVEGETLQDRIGRGPIPLDQLLRNAREIAEAVGAAHARGIVHRDVKSANIMLTPSGHVKVMDFGLAVLTTASPEEQTAHVSEELASRGAGTLPYMAPEVLRGGPATPSSDFYALGVVMYEMGTGRRPAGGRTDAQLIAEILNGQPPAPRQLNPALPRSLEALILRLLSKEPTRRPAVAEVINELNEMTEGGQKKRQRSLAVLPFQSLTRDAADAHLGLALADATTSELALVRSLLVRPTAAILRYEASADPIAAARELGVDAIVAGTVQRAGSRLRVTVQLINAAEERPLWSTKIDTTFDDIFAMQDEVSRKIVEALKVELTPADEQRFAKRIQAPGDVLELCLKGRVALLHETVAEVNAAIELFERARDIDPDNPLPWIGLSDAYTRLAFTYDPDGGWDKRAREMSDRALQLDPNIPEGHYIRGRLAWTPQAGFQHEYAIEEIAAALAERPNLNEGFDRLATILFHVGLLDEAHELYNRALAINPTDPFAERLLGTLEALRGNFAASIAIEQKSAAKGPESWGLHTLAYAQIRVNDLAGAEKTIDNASRLFPFVALYEGLRGEIAALRGDAGTAQRAIEKIVQNRKAFGHFHHVEFDVACILATLGRKEEALTWLRSGVRGGYPCLPAVENEPLFAPLRSEQVFQELVNELRTSRDHFRQVYQNVRGSFSSYF
jgi:TolB-like protein/Flp pilus assembly protein TadD